MSSCFSLAIDRLPPGTVAAIEFLPAIALVMLGAAAIALPIGIGEGIPALLDPIEPRPTTQNSG